MTDEGYNMYSSSSAMCGTISGRKYMIFSLMARNDATDSKYISHVAKSRLVLVEHRLQDKLTGARLVYSI